jgi:methionyl-tRNA synthetase
LTELAWGGLKAGTKFGEPAPLFPRAEKDAVERMQNIEDENSKSVIEAAGRRWGQRRLRRKSGTAAPAPQSQRPEKKKEAIVSSAWDSAPAPVGTPMPR